MLEIDFTEPRWLINWYHFIGGLSMILNSVGIYLLIYHTHKLGSFRYYLLACLALTLTFTVIQMESLLLCFEKKHQSIAEVTKTHIVPKPIRYIVYFVWLITPFNVFFWFSTLAMSKEEKFDYIMSTAPQYLTNFMALPNLDIYLKTTSFILFFSVVLSSGIVLNILMVTSAIDIFYLMAKLKSKISPVTYQKHREAVISIMVQFGSSTICFVPPLLMVVIVIAHVDQAQILIEVVTAWFVSHSVVNMISLLIFFPPHRSSVSTIFTRRVRAYEISNRTPFSETNLHNLPFHLSLFLCHEESERTV
ncbi:hypothetical protein CRE_28351 [Caenorhabditis remanei]|uniref:Uncharacterized protein n=1 Tax=Caenorhabditis remanei TaxID=31234 RepID=E3LLV9_CAERE|nr:hypothetical protein CRE_28351 [Caenorhabditis remanei]